MEKILSITEINDHRRQLLETRLLFYNNNFIIIFKKYGKRFNKIHLLNL